MHTAHTLARRSIMFVMLSIIAAHTASGLRQHHAVATPQLPDRRRALLSCGCGLSTCLMRPLAATALAPLEPPPRAETLRYDQPRNGMADAAFARSMSSGTMQGYERALTPTKRELFARLLASLPQDSPLVVELGMGTFPNAPFYVGSTPLDLVGVDPNDSNAEYARRSAEVAGLLAAGSSLRVTHGVGEALPFATGSVDAVVCTLTLCSVADPARVLAEVCRVLRRGGQFLFVEHVLSDDDPFLASTQRALTPLQVAAADGCHLDRRTLSAVQAAPFAAVDARHLTLAGFGPLSPVAAGIARR